MILRVHILSAFLLMVVCGCASIKPDAKVNEAIDLVEQRTGERPEWTVSWDDEPPLWDGKAVLVLDQALGLALRNNRELRADIEMIGQANADLVQAGLLQNPSFNFMLMFPSGGGRAMLRSSALPMMPLQDLWLIPAREEVAKARLQQAVLRVADRAIEITEAVKKVYARLRYTQRAIELIGDNMQVVDQSTQIIRIRLASGQATQVEVNLSQIRHLRLRSELLAMEAGHRGAQRELLMLMGVAGATDQWVVQPLRELKDSLSPPADEAALLAMATEQRLDLKAAEWDTAAAERRIALAAREGWPDLAIGLTFERAPAPPAQNQRFVGKLGNAAAQGTANAITGMPPGGPMVAPFSPKMREVKYGLGPMIEMEVPIFDQNQAQVARAFHEYRQRVAEYEARLQEITRMVRETQVMFHQAYDQIEFYRREILPAVERNLAVARQAYVAGQEDLTVYLQVQEDLLMTRLRILEFCRDWLIRLAELERQVGGRLTESGPTSRPASAPGQ
ncbi:MAG TPA: TolC family protein [Phycisphaerae bacterium]|nr:TolC family protein [Phycisphaerae bacterium]